MLVLMLALLDTIGRYLYLLLNTILLTAVVAVAVFTSCLSLVQ